MPDIGNQIFEQMLAKLELPKNDQLIRKSTEILDLIKIKNIGIINTMNENAKIVLCLDLSSNILNIPFNPPFNIHYKQSGLKRTAYQNNKKVLEKILNLSKTTATISEVCFKNKIVDPSIINKATKLFEAFKDSNKESNVDYDHPQYISIAVYVTCKLEKAKVSKKDLMSQTNLKTSQWIILEKEFENWLTKSDFGRNKGNNKRKNDSEDLEATANTMDSKKSTADVISTEIEDYDIWKKRILKEAFAELKKKLVS